MLCVVKDKSKLFVWNPYLGQTRWIQPRNSFHMSNYAIGYGKNRNHKILRISGEHESLFEYEIYDSGTNSWKDYCVTRYWSIHYCNRGVSLKGNSYFLAERVGRGHVLLCFDFTRERFGPNLPLPYRNNEAVSLSCVGEEKLAVLYYLGMWEIWVTDKIDPNAAVSWSKFLMQYVGLPIYIYAGSFLIDEEENIAVVFDLDYDKGDGSCRYQTVHIIGQDRYKKSVDIGQAPKILGKPDLCALLMFQALFN